MANILFLADGTWNGPGQADAPVRTTNVFKLYSLLAGDDDPESLALAKEQERRLVENGSLVQIAKYLHGVGDSSNDLVRMLGGAFGAGVIARIVRGYTFISRHWMPGDRIFIVGFSRGAYTARSLAGLIAAKGLLPTEDCADKEQAYRIGAAVWAAYREQRDEPDDRRSVLAEVLSHLPSFLDPASQRAARPSGPLRPASVACLAVWDTVGALGIPVYREGGDERMDVFRFCDCKLSEKVDKGYHAVAWEEQRVDFTPTLWEPRDGITQMLFAGAHADVGGGYPLAGGESDLSHIGLRWMHEQLVAEGVRFKVDPAVAFPGSAFGPSHQPWTEFPWTLAPSELRVSALFMSLPKHPSLMARIARGGVYAVLPSGAQEPPRQ